MELRTLGSSGIEASAVGLGCMGMSQSYGVPDPAEAEATLRRALEVGVTSVSYTHLTLPTKA